jgi:hypothetical protein
VKGAEKGKAELPSVKKSNIMDTDEEEEKV